MSTRPISSLTRSDSRQLAPLVLRNPYRLLPCPRISHRPATAWKRLHVERRRLHLLTAQSYISLKNLLLARVPAPAYPPPGPQESGVPRKTGVPRMISGSETTIRCTFRSRASSWSTARRALFTSMTNASPPLIVIASKFGLDSTARATSRRTARGTDALPPPRAAGRPDCPRERSPLRLLPRMALCGRISRLVDQFVHRLQRQPGDCRGLRGGVPIFAHFIILP